MGVLDVIDIEHHVVSHLQSQIELFQLLARGGIGRLRRVHRTNLVAQRRAIDLHEDQPQSMGNIFHQGRLAVARRRDEHQKPHQIGAFVLSRRAHLLGQVVANEPKVHVVYQLVAHEGAQRPRLELTKAQRVALATDHVLTQGLITPKLWKEASTMVLEPLEIIIQRQHQPLAFNAWVIAHQLFNSKAQIHFSDPPALPLRQKSQRHCFGDVASKVRQLALIAESLQPIVHQRPPCRWTTLQSLQCLYIAIPDTCGFQLCL